MRGFSITIYPSGNRAFTLDYQVGGRQRRMGEVLRKMFTLAVGWGWREDNPASAFRRRIKNEPERFLTPGEIGRLAKALDAAKDQRAAGPS